LTPGGEEGRIDETQCLRVPELSAGGVLVSCGTDAEGTVMASIVWGIDIGTSAVKVVKAKRGGEGVEVIDFDIAEIPFDEDEGTREARVKQVLTSLMSRKNIGSTPVYVSIPGNQTFFRPFTLPAVEERRVSEIVQYEARQQIPFPFEEILWGYQHQTTPEGEMQVRLVAVRRDDVNKMLGMLRGIGLNVEGLVAAPVALFNFSALEYSTDATTLILDCGAKMTDFMVMEGGAFWFRPLSVGVEEMLKTLKQKFRISQEEAVKILFKMDQSKQADKMFQVIEPVIRNLAGDVQRSLGYYKSLSHNVRVERVIGLGGAFRMPQIKEYIGKMLGQDVEIPKSVSKFTAAPGLDASWMNEEVGTMAVAFGLAIQGLGLGRANINLLPEEVVHEKMVQRKKPWAAVAVLALLAAVIVSYVVQDRVVEGYKKNIDEAGTLTKRVDELRKQYKAKNAGVEPVEKQLTLYSRIGRERPWFMDCLNKLDTALNAIDPRGDLLSEQQPQIYLQQIYMSRYPEELCRIPLEEDPNVLRPEETELGGPGGPPTPGPAPRRPTGPGGREDVKKEQADEPMEVVIYAEIVGVVDTPEARIDPAFSLRGELSKVVFFEKPDLIGGWQPYQRLAMLPDKYIEELEKKRKGEAYKIHARPVLSFKMAWRYDDGTDYRGEATAEASPKSK